MHLCGAEGETEEHQREAAQQEKPHQINNWVGDLTQPSRRAGLYLEHPSPDGRPQRSEGDGVGNQRKEQQPVDFDPPHAAKFDPQEIADDQHGGRDKDLIIPSDRLKQQCKQNLGYNYHSKPSDDWSHRSPRELARLRGFALENADFEIFSTAK